jgi:hypothetical protein
LEFQTFTDFTFVPATAGEDPTNNYANLASNDTRILNESASIVPPVFLIPKIWADPFGDGYPALDENGTPAPRTYDSSGIPMVDIDDDGQNDIITDAVTKLPGVDLDGDGLVEIDMNRSRFLAVDFNNDGIADNVLPDQNGDGVPEVDLGNDGFADFGYIPEKWSKETSRIFARWGKIHSPTLDQYQVGLGMDNMSNSVTNAMNPGSGGWLTTLKENSFELTNLTLLATKATITNQEITIDARLPMQLSVQDGSVFDGTGGEIQVGSEIMGYNSITGNVINITKRGDQYGMTRQYHRVRTIVTNQGYVLRARAAVGSASNFGAQSALKLYRVDISPPTVPGMPTSDQDASGEPAKTGVFTIRWSAAGDIESGVRAFEIQEREDNNPVWKTIRLVPGLQTTFLVGSNDMPTNGPKPSGHFYTYRVRAINNAGGASDWSPESNAASTGFPEEPISEVTNYPNPADMRQGPTHVSFILNEDAAVKITLYDLLGYEIRRWEFVAGEQGGKAGPNIFSWDGKDSSGKQVSAGGYIMRIEVIGSKGSTTVIRKIGVIN